MEWCTSEVTKINYTLIPPGFEGDVRTTRIMQERLSRMINELGEQSSQAQGLKRVITTAEKLRQCPTHILYLLRDNTIRGGEMVGLLKVGPKKLYLLDERQRTLEAEPLCVLDFYVLHDRQRLGYGKKLFDHMLQDQAVVPEEMAIDGPSPKMESFLKKNYGIEKLIKQSNNFATAPSFFTVHKNSESGRSTPAAIPSAVGRFSAPKPPSAIAQVIHGNSDSGMHKRSSKTCTPEPELELGYEEDLGDGSVVGDGSVFGEDGEVKPSPERPASLPVAPSSPVGPTIPHEDSTPSAPSPAGYTLERRDSQLTHKGYLDLKFYHNKLW